VGGTTLATFDSLFPGVVTAVLTGVAAQLATSEAKTMDNPNFDMELILPKTDGEPPNNSTASFRAVSSRNGDNSVIYIEIYPLSFPLYRNRPKYGCPACGFCIMTLHPNGEAKRIDEQWHTGQREK
jgi:hypothetical protein